MEKLLLNYLWLIMEKSFLLLLLRQTKEFLHKLPFYNRLTSETKTGKWSTTYLEHLMITILCLVLLSSFLSLVFLSFSGSSPFVSSMEVLVSWNGRELNGNHWDWTVQGSRVNLWILPSTSTDHLTLFVSHSILWSINTCIQFQQLPLLDGSREGKREREKKRERKERKRQSRNRERKKCHPISWSGIERKICWFFLHPIFGSLFVTSSSHVCHDQPGVHEQSECYLLLHQE